MNLSAHMVAYHRVVALVLYWIMIIRSVAKFNQIFTTLRTETCNSYDIGHYLQWLVLEISTFFVNIVIMIFLLL